MGWEIRIDPDFDAQLAADPEMDAILTDLVRQIGPLRRSGDQVFAAGASDTRICADPRAANLITGVRHGIAQDPTLNPVQVSALASLFVNLTEFNTQSDNATRAEPATLAAEFIRTVTQAGQTYLVRMPAEDEELGEVLYVTNSQNAAGVDWLDFVLELIVGVVGLIFALGAASKALGRVSKALRNSDLYDRLKGLLRSPTFREKFKKLADAIPGGKSTRGIFEAMKEVLSDLWEIVLQPGLDSLKKALSGVISAWTVFWTILSWLLRFLSGGAALIAELGILLGTLTVKILRPDEA